MKNTRFGIGANAGAALFAGIASLLAQFRVRAPGDGSYLESYALCATIVAAALSLLGSISLLRNARGLPRLVGPAVGVGILVFCLVMLGAVGQTTFRAP